MGKKWAKSIFRRLPLFGPYSSALALKLFLSVMGPEQVFLVTKVMHVLPRMNLFTGRVLS